MPKRTITAMDQSWFSQPSPSFNSEQRPTKAWICIAYGSSNPPDSYVINAGIEGATYVQCTQYPSWCTCGWGGDGHLGRRSDGYFNTSSPSDLRKLLAPQFVTAASYTTPNARCPVCRQSVFYYQSPNGGRVFFDELGPPWPKHPCTSTQQPRHAWIIGGAPSSAPEFTYRRRWERDRWRPFIVRTVKAVAETTDWTQLVGMLDGKDLTVYLRSQRDLNDALFHARRRADGTFDVAYIAVDSDGQTIARQTTALTVAPVTPRRFPSDRRTAIDSAPRSEQLSADTAIAQALLSAQAQRSSQRTKH